MQKICKTMENENEIVVKSLSVPIGLEELMEGLTKEVLLKRPTDIYGFASEYFSKLLGMREKGCYKGHLSKQVRTITKKSVNPKPIELPVKLDSTATKLILTGSKRNIIAPKNTILEKRKTRRSVLLEEDGNSRKTKYQKPLEKKDKMTQKPSIDETEITPRTAHRNYKNVQKLKKNAKSDDENADKSKVVKQGAIKKGESPRKSKEDENKNKKEIKNKTKRAKHEATKEENSREANENKAPASKQKTNEPNKNVKPKAEEKDKPTTEKSDFVFTPKKEKEIDEKLKNEIETEKRDNNENKEISGKNSFVTDTKTEVLVENETLMKNEENIKAKNNPQKVDAKPKQITENPAQQNESQALLTQLKILNEESKPNTEDKKNQNEDLVQENKGNRNEDHHDVSKISDENEKTKNTIKTEVTKNVTTMEEKTENKNLDLPADNKKIEKVLNAEENSSAPKEKVDTKKEDHQLENVEEKNNEMITTAIVSEVKENKIDKIQLQKFIAAERSEITSFTPKAIKNDSSETELQSCEDSNATHIAENKKAALTTSTNNTELLKENTSVVKIKSEIKKSNGSNEKIIDKSETSIKKLETNKEINIENKNLVESSAIVAESKIPDKEIQIKSNQKEKATLLKSSSELIETSKSDHLERSKSFDVQAKFPVTTPSSSPVHNNTEKTTSANDATNSKTLESVTERDNLSDETNTEADIETNRLKDEKSATTREKDNEINDSKKEKCNVSEEIIKNENVIETREEEKPRNSLKNEVADTVNKEAEKTSETGAAKEQKEKNQAVKDDKMPKPTDEGIKKIGNPKQSSYGLETADTNSVAGMELKGSAKTTLENRKEILTSKNNSLTNQNHEILEDISKNSTESISLSKEIAAVIIIQSLFRGFIARKKLKQHKEIVTVAHITPLHQTKNQKPTTFQEQVTAAITIQKFWKKIIQNRHQTEVNRKIGFGEEVRAAMIIQKFWKNIITKKHEAAIKIQANVRGYLIRKEIKANDFQRQVRAAMIIQKFWKRIMTRKHEAATKIQANFRGHSTRKQREDATQATLKALDSIKIPTESPKLEEKVLMRSVTVDEPTFEKKHVSLLGKSQSTSGFLFGPSSAPITDYQIKEKPDEANQKNERSEENKDKIKEVQEDFKRLSEKEQENLEEKVKLEKFENQERQQQLDHKITDIGKTKTTDDDTEVKKQEPVKINNTENNKLKIKQTNNENQRKLEGSETKAIETSDSEINRKKEAAEDSSHESNNKQNDNKINKTATIIQEKVEMKKDEETPIKLQNTNTKRPNLEKAKTEEKTDLQNNNKKNFSNNMKTSSIDISKLNSEIDKASKMDTNKSLLSDDTTKSLTTKFIKTERSMQISNKSSNSDSNNNSMSENPERKLQRSTTFITNENNMLERETPPKSFSLDIPENSHKSDFCGTNQLNNYENAPTRPLTSEDVEIVEITRPMSIDSSTSADSVVTVIPKVESEKQVDILVIPHDEKKLKEDMAATKIQATYRGYKTRKDLKVANAIQKEKDTKESVDDKSKKILLQSTEQQEKQKAEASKVVSLEHGQELITKLDKETKQVDPDEQSVQSSEQQERQDINNESISEKTKDEKKTNIENVIQSEETLDEQIRAIKKDLKKATDTLEKELAATKIQSTYRGHRVRRDLKNEILKDIDETPELEIQAPELQQVSSEKEKLDSMAKKLSDENPQKYKSESDDMQALENVTPSEIHLDNSSKNENLVYSSALNTLTKSESQLNGQKVENDVNMSVKQINNKTEIHEKKLPTQHESKTSAENKNSNALLQKGPETNPVEKSESRKEDSLENNKTEVSVAEINKSLLNQTEDAAMFDSPNSMVLEKSQTVENDMQTKLSATEIKTTTDVSINKEKPLKDVENVTIQHNEKEKTSELNDVNITSSEISTQEKIANVQTPIINTKNEKESESLTLADKEDVETTSTEHNKAKIDFEPKSSDTNKKITPESSANLIQSKNESSTAENLTQNLQDNTKMHEESKFFGDTDKQQEKSTDNFGESTIHIDKVKTSDEMIKKDDELDSKANNGKSLSPSSSPLGASQDGEIPLAVRLEQSSAGAQELTSPSSERRRRRFNATTTTHARLNTNDGDDGTQQSTTDFTVATINTKEMDQQNKRINSSIIKNKSVEAEAATKIQASFRGYQVRKQLKQKNGSSDITNNQRRQHKRKSSGSVSEALRDPQTRKEIEERSATKIQAGIRGFLVRKRQKNAKKSPAEAS